MEIVSAREFRTNQKKYFGMVHNGEDVILRSREWGNFRLVPVTSTDVVTNKPDITERIRQALREVKLIKEGKLKAKPIDNLINEL